MAGMPPKLGYLLYVVFLVELIKYPLTAAIPHEIAYRGAVFHSFDVLGKGWFVPAIFLSTVFYSIYHWPFDLSFSNMYFCCIITVVAIFLWRASGSLLPAIIYHASLDIFGIMASWGYYLNR
jgi:membrane protease YdiL (CAAX protease family)